MAPIGHFKDYRLGLIWGNAGAPATGGTEVTKVFDKTTSIDALGSFELPVESYTPFVINQNNRRLNRQTSHRHRTLRDTWNDTKGSIPGLSISLPATKELLDLFLYMGFQRVAEGATTPYVKSYEYPNKMETTFANGKYPEFNNDEGAFCGFVINYSTGHLSSSAQMIMTCVPTKVTFSCFADQHDGQLWIDADFIGRYYERGLTYSGTMTACSQEDTGLYHINDVTHAKILNVGTNGNASCPISGFSFTIDTGLKFVPFGGVGGGSKDIIMNGPNTSGFVDFMINDTSAGLVSAALAQQIVQSTGLENYIAWTATPAATDGDLSFNWVAQVTDFTPIGNEETKFRVAFDCVDTETGLATSSTNEDAFIVTFANAIDRGW